MKILALIHFSGIEKQTAYIEVIKTLIEKGIKVDLVIANQEKDYVYEDYYLNQDNIRLYILQSGKKKKNRIKELMKKVIHQNKWVEHIYVAFFSLYKICCFELKRKYRNRDQRSAYDIFLNECEREYKMSEDYDYIWVQDVYGLLWADWLNKGNKEKSKIVYHCLELYWENYLLQKKKKWKYSMEYSLYEAAQKILLKVSFILIQDEIRWKVLCKYTGVPENFNKVIFPVAIHDYDKCTKGDLFNSLGIGKNKKIIFYPTYFAPKRGCIELSEVAEGLDDDYMVVMHGFIGISGYADKIRKKYQKSSKIRISSVELGYQDLLNIHRDVWCIFLYYGESNYNDRFIANSSNKLAMGLQAGKPVITIGNKMLNNLCKEYNLGVALETWSKQEFRAAVDEIERHYIDYCANARKCYWERYDTSLYGDVLYKELLEYSGGNGNDRANNG